MVDVQKVLDQMKTCILIPAHNESAAIGQLVSNLRNRQLPVLVVDDGSSDGTGQIAQEKGATVLRNEQKMGKGRSLQKGFEYVLEQGYDHVIIMDGDGQHDVDDIGQFLQKALEHPASIVTGTRMQNYEGMPMVRLWTNRFMSCLISLLCRQKIPDTQCGFRLISREVLKNIKLTSSDFEIETEILVQASRKGFKIYSVPIKTIYGDEVSKIHPFKDTFRFFVYLTKEVFTRKT